MYRFFKASAQYKEDHMHLVVRFARSGKLDLNFDQVIPSFSFSWFQLDKTTEPIQAIKTLSNQFLQLLGWC